MAIDFDKIDRSVDLKGLQADVEDAKKNGGGDFPTIPAGKYEVKLESMEIKGTKADPNRPMPVSYTHLTALPSFSIKPVQWAATSNLPIKSFTSAFPKVRNCGSNPKSVFTALGKKGPVSIT